MPEDGYHGDYLEEWGKGTRRREGWGSCRRAGSHPAGFVSGVLGRAMRDIEETLVLGRIPFDVWFSELGRHGDGRVDIAIQVLRERGFVYESEGVIWFRTTDFGDEKDRVLVKSDGEYTYIAPDNAAYHLDKFRRGFDPGDQHLGRRPPLTTCRG